MTNKTWRSVWFYSSGNTNCLVSTLLECGENGPSNMVLSIELHRWQLEAILLSINLKDLVANIWIADHTGIFFSVFFACSKMLDTIKVLSISVEYPPCNERLERYRIVLNICEKKILDSGFHGTLLHTQMYIVLLSMYVYMQSSG